MKYQSFQLSLCNQRKKSGHTYNSTSLIWTMRKCSVKNQRFLEWSDAGLKDRIAFRTLHIFIRKSASFSRLTSVDLSWVLPGRNVAVLSVASAAKVMEWGERCSNFGFLAKPRGICCRHASVNYIMFTQEKYRSKLLHGTLTHEEFIYQPGTPRLFP